ncbi:MAG: 2OG-Fe dioxygenase family protein [Nevskia sp.]|nr:2OG-Fe dioxygenase family protein [Nevskia sp.]
MNPDQESTLADTQEQLSDTLRRKGYAFVPAAQMRQLTGQPAQPSDWDQFAASWNDLRLDQHMADGGRYRKRRHAVFSLGADGSVVRQPHQPHYQGVDYNPLNGGVQRWFEPVTPQAGASASLHRLLALCHTILGVLAPRAASWKVEMHQFRIEARHGEPGQPTPEGPHRDGVDYVLVLLVARQNIEQGTTVVYDLARRELGSFTLTLPFDTAFVEDARVYHGVTAVTPLDPALPAYRDVLVLTFRAQDAG